MNKDSHLNHTPEPGGDGGVIETDYFSDGRQIPTLFFFLEMTSALLA